MNFMKLTAVQKPDNNINALVQMRSVNFRSKDFNWFGRSRSLNGRLMVPLKRFTHVYAVIYNIRVQAYIASQTRYFTPRM